MYSKYEMRCLLKDPAVNPKRPPQDFQPISPSKFATMVEPIFEDPAYKKLLRNVTLESYKKMKLLPVLLVQIILNEAGITPTL